MTGISTLAELAAAFDLRGEQPAALDRYVDAILAWPGNVTALRARHEVVGTLLGDALALLDVPRLPVAGSWLDLGAGAGIPGIPLAVVRPAVRLTLLDSAARKCAFLREAVRAAAIGGRATVVCARSEEHAASGAAGREAYDVVLARAVAPLPALVELASPLLHAGGLLLASKTAASVREEGPSAALAAARCGLASLPVVPLPRSPLAAAVCAVFEKTGDTPSSLPRRPGMAVKRPLG